MILIATFAATVCLSPALAAAVAEPSLDLRGVWFQSSDGRDNYGVFLGLSIPLERPRPSSLHAGLWQDEATTPVDEVPLDPLERDTVEPAADVLESSAPLAAGEPVDWSREYVTELALAAVATAGCDDALARLETLGVRNRLSALLPEVTLRAGREQNAALRLTPTDVDPFRYTQSDASNTLLEGRLSWRLGRLLFSTEDIGVERLRLARYRERERAISRAIAVFLQWLRAKSIVLNARAVTPRRLHAARWQLVESAIRLDALTGGWFSEHPPALKMQTPAGPTQAQPPSSSAAGRPKN